MSNTQTAALPQPSLMKSVLSRRRPLTNVHEEVLERIAPLDRLALWITVPVGSMAFFPRCCTDRPPVVSPSRLAYQ
jgi:hypothetical protein